MRESEGLGAKKQKEREKCCIALPAALLVRASWLTQVQRMLVRRRRSSF